MMRSGCEWVNTALLWLMPLTDRVSAVTSHRQMPISRPMPIATIGASSSAQAALDSTVFRSDSGSDFQNSTLRSRRSSYSEPSA